MPSKRAGLKKILLALTEEEKKKLMVIRMYLSCKSARDVSFSDTVMHMADKEYKGLTGKVPQL